MTQSIQPRAPLIFQSSSIKANKETINPNHLQTPETAATIRKFTNLLVVCHAPPGAPHSGFGDLLAMLRPKDGYFVTGVCKTFLSLGVELLFLWSNMTNLHVLGRDTGKGRKLIDCVLTTAKKQFIFRQKHEHLRLFVSRNLRLNCSLDFYKSGDCAAPLCQI